MNSKRKVSNTSSINDTKDSNLTQSKETLNIKKINFA